jgi:hypothetical protein
MRYFAAAVVVSLVLLSASVFSQTYGEVQDALAAAEAQIAGMQARNFSVSMANDTLSEASQILAAQELINKSGGKPDYSIVMQKANAVGVIEKNAFNAYDELVALEKTVSELAEDDRAALTPYVEDARAEFYSERYDRVGEKVDVAYQKISEQQALNTRVAAMLDASRRNISGFFYYNWPYVLAAGVILAAFAVVFAGRFTKYRINRKMRLLGMEKDVIMGLIKDTQRMYFELGKISEDMYTVRMQKFEELIRDIERQLPMLREELEMHRGLGWVKK